MNENNRPAMALDLSAYQEVILAIVLYPKLVLSKINPPLSKELRSEAINLKEKFIEYLLSEKLLDDDDMVDRIESNSVFEDKLQHIIERNPVKLIEFIHNNKADIFRILNSNLESQKQGDISFRQISNELKRNPNYLKAEDDEHPNLIVLMLLQFPDLQIESRFQRSSVKIEDGEVFDNDKTESEEFLDSKARVSKDKSEAGDFEEEGELSFSEGEEDNQGEPSPFVSNVSRIVLESSSLSSLDDVDTESSFINPGTSFLVKAVDKDKVKSQFNDYYQRLRRCEKKSLERMEYHLDRPEKYSEWTLRLNNIRLSLKDLIKNYSELKEYNVYSIDLRELDQILTKEYEAPCKFKGAEHKVGQTIDSEFSEELLSTKPSDLEEKKAMLASYIHDLHSLRKLIEAKIPDAIKGDNQADANILITTFKDIGSKIKNAEDYQRYLMDNSQVSIFQVKLEEIMHEFETRDQYIYNLKNKVGILDHQDLHATFVEQQIEPTVPEDISQESDDSSISDQSISRQPVRDNPVVGSGDASDSANIDTQIPPLEFAPAGEAGLAETNIQRDEELPSSERHDLEERKAKLESYIDDLNALSKIIDDKIPASIKGEIQVDISFLQSASKDIRAKIKNAKDYQRYLMDDAKVSISEVNLNEIMREFDSRTQYIENIKKKVGVLDHEDMSEIVVAQQIELPVPENIAHEPTEDDLVFLGGETTIFNPNAALPEEEAANIEQAQQGMKRRPQSGLPTAQDMQQRLLEGYQLQDNSAENGQAETLTSNEKAILINKYLSALEKLKTSLLLNAKNAQDNGQEKESGRFMDFHESVQIRINHAETYLGCLEGRIVIDEVDLAYLTNQFYSMPKFIQDINQWVGIVDIMDGTHDLASKQSINQNQSHTIEHISESGRAKWFLRQQQHREEQDRAKEAANMQEQVALPNIVGHQANQPMRAVHIPPLNRNLEQLPVQALVSNDFYQEVIQLAVGVGLSNPVGNQENGITFTKKESVNAQSQPSQVYFQGTQEQWTVKGNHLSAMVALASEVALNDPNQSTVLTIETKDKSNPACMIQDLLALMQLTQKGLPVNTTNLNYLYNLKLHSEQAMTSLHAAFQRHPDQYPLLNKGINTAEDVTDLISRSLQEASTLQPQRGSGFNFSSG